MKKTITIFSITILMLTLFGCTMGNSPKAKVERLLGNYQSKSENIISELDDYLKYLNVEENNHEDYKKVYTKQYEDLKYEIKDENIDGDNATVIAQIDVYDYYKTENEVSNYIASNPNEFNENGTYSPEKSIKYKIEELKKTKERVTYTITFNLTKVNDEWTIDNLTQEDLEKIHGIYAH